jgi:hypothetical protein
MKNDHGTTCLITERGLADKYLERAREKIRLEKIISHQPRDSWTI